MSKKNKYHSAIIRHGVAKYEMLDIGIRGAWPQNEFLDNFEGIKDLKENSIDELSEYFDNYVSTHLDILKSKERIDLWVSPYARTIQTAYLFLESLQKHGIDTHKICLFDKIGEVKNFSWGIFSKLVDGGEVQINGKKIILDKKMTNPQGLDYTNYFFESYWLKIDNKYLEQLGIMGSINSIESYQSVTQRSQETLSKLLSISDNKMVFIVSHQAVSDWILKHGENYKNKGQNPGEIILIGNDLNTNNKAYVRHTNGKAA